MALSIASLLEALSDEELKSLVDRVAKIRPLKFDEIPRAELKRWLEIEWSGGGVTDLLQSQSITTEYLADGAVTAAKLNVPTVITRPTAGGGGNIGFPSDSWFRVGQGAGGATAFFYQFPNRTTSEQWEVGGAVLVDVTTAAWARLIGRVEITDGAATFVSEVGRGSVVHHADAADFPLLIVPNEIVTLPAGQARRMYLNLQKVNAIGIAAQYYNAAEIGGPRMYARRVS